MSRCENREESFVGFLQLYSDKTAMTLRKVGIDAYPVHVLFMNFEYGQWKKTIVDEESIVSFLPVEYENSEDMWRCYGKAYWKT